LKPYVAAAAFVTAGCGRVALDADAGAIYAACDGATPEQACGDPKCRAAIVEQCFDNPAIDVCGCTLNASVVACTTDSDCPANMYCAEFNTSYCNDAGPCIETAKTPVCWPKH
jgi:hypothetical protein